MYEHDIININGLLHDIIRNYDIHPSVCEIRKGNMIANNYFNHWSINLFGNLKPLVILTYANKGSILHGSLREVHNEVLLIFHKSYSVYPKMIS